MVQNNLKTLLVIILIIGLPIYLTWPKKPQLIVDNFTNGYIELYVDDEFIGEFENWTENELKIANKNYLTINEGEHWLKVIDKKTKTVLNNERINFQEEYYYLLNAGKRVVYSIGYANYGLGSSSINNYKPFVFELSKSDSHYFETDENLPLSIKTRDNSYSIFYFYRIGLDLKTECDKSVSFGDIDICLPIIDGMTECYSTPILKARADELNYEGNSILAYYLNNATYEQVDKLDEITFDDYIQIYATNKLKGIKVGQSELSEIANMFEGNYIKENWNDLKKKVEKNRDYLSVGRPVIIESYSPNNKVRTYVMLTKYQIDNNEFVLLMTMNMVQIKERLIWLAYYKNYDGEESIKKAKSKNDYIVSQMTDENK